MMNCLKFTAMKMKHTINSCKIHDDETAGGNHFVNTINLLRFDKTV